MSYEYFTINVRNKLEVLLKENYRISKIAQILNLLISIYENCVESSESM